MASSDPLPVLAEYLPLASIRAIQPLGNAGGWSGSLLWRVKAQTPSSGRSPSIREFCLRRWPKVTARARVIFIHEILTHVAAHGIGYIPSPIQTRSASEVVTRTRSGREATLVKHDGYLWDLTPWLPGAADYHSNPSRLRLAAAMHALARFHTAAATISKDPPHREIVPAVVERLDEVHKLLSGELEHIAAAVSRGLSAELDLLAQRLLSLAGSHLEPLVAPLEAASHERLALSPAIRDIHHDHVLFQGDQVTGLVDFGALRIDTPLADVARLVGSLVGDDAAERDFALAAYGELRPLADHDRWLIDLLDRSGTVLGGLNWLRWLYLDRRDMGPLPPLARRLDAILARLRTLRG